MSEISTKVGVELTKLDTKFSKAIAEVLCSIGELRTKMEENDQGTCGYLNGHDMELQALKRAMTEVNQANERRLNLLEETSSYTSLRPLFDRVDSLEKQVKKLFAVKTDEPYTLKLSNSPETRIKTLVSKLQNAIREYNRG